MALDPITDTELDQVEQLAKRPGYLVPTRMACRIIARLRAAEAVVSAIDDICVDPVTESAVQAWRAARGEAP